jgi:clan AA aspartic protease (TIGR02281 family)
MQGGWRHGGRAGLCVAALLALAGCAAEDNRPCRLAVATALPFRPVNGHLYVDVSINGKVGNFIFDTGAEQTTLDRAAIARLGLTARDLPGVYSEGIGGSNNASLTSTRNVQLGRLKGAHFSLMVSDMHMVTAHPPSDGLLGMDFLTNYDIDIDWAARRAVLYAKLQGCSKPSAALTGPLYALTVEPMDGMHPKLRFPVIINGQTFHAILDTGAQETAIFRHAAERLGLTKAVLAADRHFYAAGVGQNRVDAARHVLQSVTIGDLTIKNMPVAVTDQRFGDVDMLLGLPFTRQVHVWISNSSHTLIMQYPPAPSPKLPGT